MRIIEILTESEKWVHSGRHADGSWTHMFSSEQKALDDLGKYINDRPLVSGVVYYDDNGGVHRVSSAPNNVKSAEEVERIRQAYDARETGTATKAQLKLLDKLGY